MADARRARSGRAAFFHDFSYSLAGASGASLGLGHYIAAAVLFVASPLVGFMSGTWPDPWFRRG